MALIDDFKARFPEFATATVDQYLPILEPVWPCYYGRPYEDCNQEIVLNLVAHLLVQETASGSSAAQVVQSKSVGSVSVSYAAQAQSNSLQRDWLMSTKYGQRFYMLTQHKHGGVAV